MFCPVHGDRNRREETRWCCAEQPGRAFDSRLTPGPISFPASNGGVAIVEPRAGFDRVFPRRSTRRGIRGSYPARHIPQPPEVANRSPRKALSRELAKGIVAVLSERRFWADGQRPPLQQKLFQLLQASLKQLQS